MWVLVFINGGKALWCGSLLVSSQKSWNQLSKVHGCNPLIL
jgi:hypothetical protein